MRYRTKIAFILLLPLFLLCGSSTAFGQQGLGFGFKAGLNFSSFDGPSEQFEGMDLEEFTNETGFHVGALIKYKFTRSFGVESGFYYSQKGASYAYEGSSYFIIRDLTDEFAYATGERQQSLNITNGYLHFPFLAYYKLGRNVEFNVGAYLDLLVSSTAQGDVIFDGVSQATGDPIDRFRFTLGYKYLKDDPGEWKGTRTRQIMVDGENYVVPRSLGAYYYFEPEFDEKYFRTLDFGLMAGGRYFVNESLFLGLGVSLGLSDVTNNDADFSRMSLDEENNFIFRDDKDTNFSIQASVGFSF